MLIISYIKLNKKMKIRLIIGLPCSGKTTLLNFLEGFNIDDIKSLEQLPEKADCLNITSPQFIFQSVRNAAVNHLKKKYQTENIELIFFENSVEKCLNNLRKRGDEKEKKVESFIKNFSTFYIIPEGVFVLEINQS